MSNKVMHHHNNLVSSSKVVMAYQRICPFLHSTPLMESTLLNRFLQHRVLFKQDLSQKTGSFKVRGVLNALLSLKEKNHLPQSVVAYSSGNHAQAVSWACTELSIPCTIYMPAVTSEIKIQATLSYGGKVVLTSTRQEAEDLCIEASKKEGVLLLTPYGREDVLIGQGTFSYEALSEIPEVDSIFTTVGGGGLCAGTWLTCQEMSLPIPIYGCEALKANKASRSLQGGSIFRFPELQQTIADGARPLSVAQETWPYIQKLKGIIECEEEEIIYWTQWLMHLLKITCEPTAALAMAGGYQWLMNQNTPSTILILLSGGNISSDMYKMIWRKNYLDILPTITPITI